MIRLIVISAFLAPNVFNAFAHTAADNEFGIDVSAEVSVCLRIPYHLQKGYVETDTLKHLIGLYSRVVVLCSEKMKADDQNCEQTREVFFKSLQQSDLSNFISNDITKQFELSSEKGWNDLKNYRKFVEIEIKRLSTASSNREEQKNPELAFIIGVNRFILNAIDSKIQKHQNELSLKVEAYSTEPKSVPIRSK